MDRFLKYAQDQFRDALIAQLSAILALAPEGQEEFYTYTVLGAKDLLPSPIPFRQIQVTASAGLNVSNSSCINCKISVAVNSRVNVEDSETENLPPDTDVFGTVHNIVQSFVYEYLVSSDFEWLYYIEMEPSGPEEANTSLVDNFAFDIYYPTPD